MVSLASTSTPGVRMRTQHTTPICMQRQQKHLRARQPASIVWANIKHERCLINRLIQAATASHQTHTNTASCDTRNATRLRIPDTHRHRYHKTTTHRVLTPSLPPPKSSIINKALSVVITNFATNLVLARPTADNNTTRAHFPVHSDEKTLVPPFGLLRHFTFSYLHKV